MLAQACTGREKPRHLSGEAGLVITSDSCPATPDFCTRRVASLMRISFVFDSAIGRSRDQRARARPANRALALRRGRDWLWGGIIAPPLAVGPRDDRVLREERRAPSSGDRGRSTHHSGERRYEMLSLCLAMSRD